MELVVVALEALADSQAGVAAGGALAPPAAGREALVVLERSL